MMKNKDGMEYSEISPSWIKKKVPESYADDDLRKIVLFYVINTPCTRLSSSAISLSEYGWDKDVWKTEDLKNKLLCCANLCKGKSFFVAKTVDGMKDACKNANMQKGFHKMRDEEKIVLYKNGYNEFMSILYHIRNALAHGRLAMYEIKGEPDIFFALEDGVRAGDKFQVRSRMLLKRSTLLKWIAILRKEE